jgi:two-component system CheB/CheR fusion protein
VYAALKRLALTEIAESKPKGTPIRIWVPGCSTGQEACSVAMTLTEFFDGRPYLPPIRLVATDLSEAGTLEKARSGVCPDRNEAEVSPARLRRFF